MASFDVHPHHGYRAGDHIPGVHRPEHDASEGCGVGAGAGQEERDERAVAEILGILRTRVEAIDDLRKVFKRFDADASGRIAEEELRAVLAEAYHIVFTQSQFDMLMRHLDTDGDGSVDYVEFARMLGEQTYRMTHQDDAKMALLAPRGGDDDVLPGASLAAHVANNDNRAPPHRNDDSRRSVVINEGLNEEHSAPRGSGGGGIGGIDGFGSSRRSSFIRRPPTDSNQHENAAYTVRLQQVLEMLRNKIKSQKSLRDSFRNFDEDKNGFIDIDEFKRVIHSLHLDLDDDDCMAIIKYCDQDFNGVLDYQEFCDKFNPKWNAGADKDAAHRAVTPRASITNPEQGSHEINGGGGGGGGHEYGGSAGGDEEMLRDLPDAGTAAKHIQSRALGPGPRLADALCHGLHPVSFAPLLQQFRLADAGRSGFIPLSDFRKVIGEQLRNMNMSTRLAYDRYADLDADTDKHGYVDYITFYDRIAIASSAIVPTAVATKPQFVKGYTGGTHGGHASSYGGEVVNMDTLAGFRKPAYVRTPTVGHIPYKDATRGVSRHVLAERQFSRGGIAGYLTRGEGMETPGVDRLGRSFDHLSGGRSGILLGEESGGVNDAGGGNGGNGSVNSGIGASGGGGGGGGGSMFSGGTSSAAVGKYAAPSLRHHHHGSHGGGSSAIGGVRRASGAHGGGGGGGGGYDGTSRGALQPALHRPGRHTHTKFPNTGHMTSAPVNAPAYGDDEQRYYGHAGSGLVEDPHTGMSPRFPPGPKQQYTSRYEAKLERMRNNEERVLGSYEREEAVKEMYESNRLNKGRQQRRRWRGQVNEQTEKMDATYGRDNFSVVRYGGPDALSHVMSEVVGGQLPRPSFVPAAQLRHSEGTGKATGMKDFFSRKTSFTRNG